MAIRGPPQGGTLSTITHEKKGVFMKPYTALSNEELLSMTVMERKGESVARSLLEVFESVPRLIQSDEAELLRIKGVGKKRARQLKAVLELARRLYAVDERHQSRITSPRDAAAIVVPDLRYELKEHFKLLILDTKHHVLAYETVSVGSLNASIVHPREVFLAAVKKSAAGIILVHNHPSGDPTPSQEDINITKRLMDAGEIMGIKVLDHIIVGGGNHLSLKESGSI